MDNQPIRIAHIIGKMMNGGVEAVVFNYYRNIDKNKFQFDFFYDADSIVQPSLELIEMGAKFYQIPPYQRIISYERELIKLFKLNKYKIVHSHMNTLSIFSLRAAKRAGVPIRIAHNHSTAGKGETKKNIMKYMLRPFAKIYPTHLAACSRYAGEWLFGKNAEFIIVNNAIDVNKFKFHNKTRLEMRRKLGIEEKFVVGHVGRFCYQKNHDFIIDIFIKVKQIRFDACLLLIGDGELLNEIKNKVISLGINDSVIFISSVNDINRYYQVMDVFVFPSRYEGLGMVAVEAQISGLPVFIGNAVPKEAKISDSFYYLSLKETPLKWAEQLCKKCDIEKRIDMMKTTINSDYDIYIAANKLLKWYNELITSI